MTPHVRVSAALVSLAVLIASASAQEPVSVGKGSYAAFPPPGLVNDNKRNVDLVEEVEQRKLYRVTDDDRPVPSNKWYQNLLFQRYGTGLWAMPHKVDATKEGFEVSFPTTFLGDGTRSLAEFPLVIGGKDFKPTDSRAKHWADWMVSFRLPETDAKFVDVTLGEGMPFVWAEYTGVTPTIWFGGHGGKGSRGKNPAAYFDLGGNVAVLPVTGDTLGITYEGRSYAVFAPDGTTFDADGSGGVAVTFAGKPAFLVVCPLPTANDIGLFHEHAFAVPRDTRLNWRYDRAAGTLSTTWTVTAEPLKGTARSVLQGWLPHHWRDGTADVEFADITYRTIRGTLRLAAGNTFTLTYPFHGVLPNLPTPDTTSGYDPARMKAYLADSFASRKTALGGDTYGGGKDLQRFAQAALMAHQTGDPSFDAIAGKLRGELENWLTYTPGEKNKFFAYYPRRKGLVGFSPSFGSQHFTDHHFHYGYLTFSAALLSQMQPDFAAGYGDMAKLVAKTYANADRDDKRFPFLRTFDIWRGHSFADGNGFPEGNNQESTGEAVNSWVGMILLGEALGDADLTDAGVMGYVFETRANMEYWFDPHGDVFPSTYAHDACGMIWCNSVVWGTWFTASPSWIYGIQWLPSGPWMSFYDRDPTFIKRVYADLVRELDAFEVKEAARKPGAVKKATDIKSQGGELGAYHLGFNMHADPAWVCEQLDTLWKEPGDNVAHNEWMAAIYYQAHALKTLGRVDWSVHADSPTATAYLNAATKARTFVAWNPTDRPRTVTFFADGKPLGRATVPARRLLGFNALEPAK
jgi:endoglucanase Acf2